MAKPGVMFYFDTRPSLRRLTIEDKGRLFEAILDFGEYGVIPEFEGVLGVAWDFIQPRIDRDGRRYDDIVEKRTQAAKARWAKEKDTDASACKCISVMPTTTTTTNTTSTTTTTTTSTSTPTDETPFGLPVRTDSDLTMEERRNRAMNHFRSYVADEASGNAI